MASKYWCETCEDTTQQVEGYCMICGTDTLWGGPPKNKKLCAWCFIYPKQEGTAFCRDCNGDMETADNDWMTTDDYWMPPVKVTVIPSVEEEVERIPCRTRK